MKIWSKEVDVFNNEEMAEVGSWVKEIRILRKKISDTKFDDIADYCVARREETIKLFMEMSKFIEDNLDVFYNPNWEWVPSNKCWEAQMNKYNPVQTYKKTDKDYLHIWISGGLKFLLRLSSKRVLWITHERELSSSSKDTTPDMEKWKYNFFNFWDGGEYPTEGYEKYVKTPTFETYFGAKPKSPQEYIDIKRKVEQDWENAKACQACLKKAIIAINDCDKELLSNINSMKVDIRLARKDEGI